MYIYYRITSNCSKYTAALSVPVKVLYFKLKVVTCFELLDSNGYSNGIFNGCSCLTLIYHHVKGYVKNDGHVWIYVTAFADFFCMYALFTMHIFSCALRIILIEVLLFFFKSSDFFKFHMREKANKVQSIPFTRYKCMHVAPSTLG